MYRDSPGFLRKALAAALTFVVLALSPGQVFADGGIRVTSQTHESRFPKEVLFHLWAEADSEIRKITLYHRIGNTTSTAYAYPTFTPGRDVQAKYSLRTGGGSVVPGSEVQYFYEIEDSSGKTLRTEPVKIVYEDTRFTWRKLETEGITVYYYGQDQRARIALEAAQETLVKMKTRAGVTLERPAKIYLYDTKQEMDAALPFMSETTTREVGWAGMAFAHVDEVIILGSTGGLKSVTAHELTHLLTHQLTDNPFSQVPSWLNEGLSMYSEDQSRSGFGTALESAIKRNQVSSLRSVSTMPGKPEQISAFYGQAESVVKYLVDTYGPDRMPQLLGAIKQGTTVDEALQRVYGFDVDGLDARWRAFVGAPPLASSGATPAHVDTVPTITPFGAVKGPSGPTQEVPNTVSPYVLPPQYAAGIGAVLLLGALSLALRRILGSRR